MTKRAKGPSLDFLARLNLRPLTARELGETKNKPGSRRYVKVGTTGFSPRTKTYSLRQYQQSRLGHSIEERGKRNRALEAAGEVLPKNRRQKRAVEVRVAAAKSGIEETKRKHKRFPKILKREIHMLITRHHVPPEVFGYGKEAKRGNHAIQRQGQESRI
jgi:hypothetical protein